MWLVIGVLLNVWMLGGDGLVIGVDVVVDFFFVGYCVNV